LIGHGSVQGLKFPIKSEKKQRTEDQNPQKRWQRRKCHFRQFVKSEWMQVKPTACGTEKRSKEAIRRDHIPQYESDCGEWAVERDDRVQHARNAPQSKTPNMSQSTAPGPARSTISNASPGETPNVSQSKAHSNSCFETHPSLALRRIRGLLKA
jgi:hypothetical protein